MRPQNAFRNSVFGASKLASAKTPLLKPYYRLHGSVSALVYAHLRSFPLICVFLHPTAFRTTAFGTFRAYSNGAAHSQVFGARKYRALTFNILATSS